MEEPHPDDGALSPEDLKRLGLAGQGDLPLLRRTGHRIREDLAAFRRELRPSWRGLLGTMAVCVAFSWFGTALPMSLHDWDWPAGFELPEPPPFLEAVTDVLKNRIQNPWGHLAGRSMVSWQLGGFGLGPILAFFAGVALLRSMRGSAARGWIGAAAVAAGLTGIVWSLSRPSDPHRQTTFVALLVPSAVVTLTAVSAALWLVLRATRLSRAPSRLSECLPFLLLTGLVALNLAIAIRCEIQSFTFTWQLDTGQSTGGGPQARISETVSQVTIYSVTVLCTVLIFFPAWIVLRGHTFGTAVTTLRRLVIRRPAAAFLSLLGLTTLALLPISALPYEALKSLRLITYYGLEVFPDSVVWALFSGLETGLFIYAIALAATALHDSLPAEAAVTPPDAG